MKEFVFLYPIPEYIETSMQNSGMEGNGPDRFRRKYKKTLNTSIDQRYRQKGFGVNYVVFDGHAVSDAIELQASDRIINAGMDFKTHITKQSNGEYAYPNPDKILDQLGNTDTVRIGGFHLWDCVERLAQTAHKRGLDVLVDEDLTEIFGMMIQNPNFRTDTFPSYDPKKAGKAVFDIFMQARKTRPWLWQDY